MITAKERDRDMLRIMLLISIVVLCAATAPAEFGRDWTCATSDAPWGQLRSGEGGGRSDLAAVSFNGYIYVVGGGIWAEDYEFGGYSRYPQDDVWRSSDGIQWELVLDDAPWGDGRSTQSWCLKIICGY